MVASLRWASEGGRVERLVRVRVRVRERVRVRMRVRVRVRVRFGVEHRRVAVERGVEESGRRRRAIQPEHGLGQHNPYAAVGAARLQGDAPRLVRVGVRLGLGLGLGFAEPNEPYP